MWHKAVLLISAAPITVFMNSVRIAVAGIIAQNYGVDWLDGFTHFFEGWVIFIACILLLFLLARIMLFMHLVKMSLTEALDLETEGLATQAKRIRFAQASPAMILTAVLMVGAATAWQFLPERGQGTIDRQSFESWPRQIGDWHQTGTRRTLSDSVVTTLGADDYVSVRYTRADTVNDVEFFSAWYADQSKGGVHSPEICLPGGGWEIAWLERSDLTETLNWDRPFLLNRAIIQKGQTRMMVYYWFDQKGRKIAWDFEAKFWLRVGGIATGRTDGALVRITTAIKPGESDGDADARLMDMLKAVMVPLPTFIPDR